MNVRLLFLTLGLYTERLFTVTGELKIVRIVGSLQSALGKKFVTDVLVSL